MTIRQRTLLIALLVLLILAAAGMLKTAEWLRPTSSPSGQTGSQNASAASLVDQRPLQTAQKVASLATTPEEQPFAQEALRLADQEVDLAFAAALRNAVEHPPAPTAETRAILIRIQDAEDRIQDGQDRVTALNKSIAAASASRKDTLQQDLDLVQAQLELDQDELADAQEDLIRAGGDKQTLIQRMLDEHEAASHQTAGSAPPTLPSSTSSALSGPGWNPYSLIAEYEVWNGLRSKQALLRQAQKDANEQQANLIKSHEAIEADIKKQKAQPGNTLKPGQSSAEVSPETLVTLRHLSEEQKEMAAFDKRIEDEKELSQSYGQWIQLVQGRQRTALHALLRSLVWILIIGVLMLIAEICIERYFAELAAQRRRLRSLRTVVEFAAQFVGILLILLVIFGPPNQLATIVALAGAGLTVALKDFIVGFLGWFVLMGKNGISLGDWVEINGVGGEVVEIGLLHTVLLETGSWTEAGHPTGRRVSFVNSYAIEGHYFNFSTSGQWLWDELQVFVPSGEDPSPISQGIQKMVEAETEANARLAEKEWERVTSEHGLQSFSASPYARRCWSAPYSCTCAGSGASSIT